MRIVVNGPLLRVEPLQGAMNKGMGGVSFSRLPRPMIWTSACFTFPQELFNLALG